MPREAASSELEFTHTIDTTRTWTTVMVVGDRYGGIGNAKRHPHDPVDYQIGIDVASVRALRDLADQIESGIAYRR